MGFVGPHRPWERLRAFLADMIEDEVRPGRPRADVKKRDANKLWNKTVNIPASIGETLDRHFSEVGYRAWRHLFVRAFFYVREIDIAQDRSHLFDEYCRGHILPDATLHDILDAGVTYLFDAMSRTDRIREEANAEQKPGPSLLSGANALPFPYNFGVTVCPKCDPVKPEHLGNKVEDICPECGGEMFGLKGSE